ncbi:unnamed protein product [Closterium sp. Yama58-4]|nr:unnamed protein product [Closterium sp. Yama58-4]
MYYTYLQVAGQPGSDMKHFTRVLHRSTDDALMDVMPTVRVKPLDPSCDTWCEYPVASRPFAIQQWLESGDVKGDWIFMIETDYIFVKPVTIPPAGRALGFPFDYIAPQDPELRPFMRRYYPEPYRIEDVPRTGNAPTIMRYDEMMRVVPIWVNVTARIEGNAESKERFGWVREMYAFSISVALAGVKIDLPPMPHAIMSQPPADKVVGDAALLHYTWGSQIKDWSGNVIWEFDKRKFTDRGLPDPVPEPPEGKASESQKVLVAKVNEAINHLPKYTLRELREMGRSDAEIDAYEREWRAKGYAEGGGGGEMKQEQQGDVGQVGGAGQATGQGGGVVRGGAVAQQEVAKPVVVPGEVEKGSIHAMVTSNGNPYMNWQTLLMFHTYKKVRRKERETLLMYHTYKKVRRKEREVLMYHTYKKVRRKEREVLMYHMYKKVRRKEREVLMYHTYKKVRRKEREVLMYHTYKKVRRKEREVLMYHTYKKVRRKEREVLMYHTYKKVRRKEREVLMYHTYKKVRRKEREVLMYHTYKKVRRKEREVLMYHTYKKVRRKEREVLMYHTYKKVRRKEREVLMYHTYKKVRRKEREVLMYHTYKKVRRKEREVLMYHTYKKVRRKEREVLMYHTYKKVRRKEREVLMYHTYKKVRRKEREVLMYHTYKKVRRKEREVLMYHTYKKVRRKEREVLMYHTYKKAGAYVASEPGSNLRFFTRVLHRTRDDELMHLVPTVRVRPLEPKCDDWCEYPVADRPFAIQQWLESGDVKGEWIFMIETDYLFVKPVAIPPTGRALGFPFGYIIPTYPSIHHIMIRYYPGDLKDIPQTGNAPVLAPTAALARVVPIWVDITARFEKDEEAKKDLGWVREMYAFSIAAALGNMPIDLPLVPHAIMVQPPADSVLGDAAIIHYTWGYEFKDEADNVVWRFDKRDYTQPGQVPPILADPPQGKASELQLIMVRVINDAIRTVFYPGTNSNSSPSATPSSVFSAFDGEFQALPPLTPSSPTSSPLASPPNSPLSSVTAASALTYSPAPLASPAPAASPAASAAPALPRRLKGVRQRKWGRWVTEIRCPRTMTRVWLGSYATAEEAVRVYDMAALMIFGEVASKVTLNAPDAAPRPVTVAKSIAEALIKVARASSGDGDATPVDLSAFVTPWAHSLLFPDAETLKRKLDSEVSTFMDSTVPLFLPNGPEKRARISETSFNSIKSSPSATPSSILSAVDGEFQLLTPLPALTASPQTTSPLASPPISPFSSPSYSSALACSPAPSSPPAPVAPPAAGLAAAPALPRRLKGVRQRKWGRWVTEIRCPRTKTRVWLGSYATAEEAVRVYDMAARMIFGEVASSVAVPRPVTVAKSIAEALIRVARANNDDGDATPVDLSAFRGDMASLEVVGQNVVVSECPFEPLAPEMEPSVLENACILPKSQSATSTNEPRDDVTSDAATINGAADYEKLSASDVPSALSLIEELFDDSFCDMVATPAAMSPSFCDLGDFESLENVSSLWEEVF